MTNNHQSPCMLSPEGIEMAHDMGYCVFTDRTGMAHAIIGLDEIAAEGKFLEFLEHHIPLLTLTTKCSRRL